MLYLIYKLLTSHAVKFFLPHYGFRGALAITVVATVTEPLFHWLLTNSNCCRRKMSTEAYHGANKPTSDFGKSRILIVMCYLRWSEIKFQRIASDLKERLPIGSQTTVFTSSLEGTIPPLLMLIILTNVTTKAHDIRIMLVARRQPVLVPFLTRLLLHISSPFSPKMWFPRVISSPVSGHPWCTPDLVTVAAVQWPGGRWSARRLRGLLRHDLPATPISIQA